MEGVEKINTIIILLLFLTMSMILWNNSQKDITSVKKDNYVETFLFEPPLIKVMINSEQKNDLRIEKKDDYLGTKISLGEYHFKINNKLTNITNVTYEFSFPKKLLEENDINPETITLYTPTEEGLEEVNTEEKEEKVFLTSKTLIPILILADPNEEEKVSEKEIYHNSESNISKFVDGIFGKKKNIILIFGFLIGLIITTSLITLERKKFPKKHDKKKNLEQFIIHFRKEGFSDEELTAILIERGVKAIHAEMLVKKK